MSYQDKFTVNNFLKIELHIRINKKYKYRILIVKISLGSAELTNKAVIIPLQQIDITERKKTHRTVGDRLVSHV